MIYIKNYNIKYTNHTYNNLIQSADGMTQYAKMETKIVSQLENSKDERLCLNITSQPRITY